MFWEPANHVHAPRDTIVSLLSSGQAQPSDIHMLPVGEAMLKLCPALFGLCLFSVLLMHLSFPSLLRYYSALCNFAQALLIFSLFHRLVLCFQISYLRVGGIVLKPASCCCWPGLPDHSFVSCLLHCRLIVIYLFILCLHLAWIWLHCSFRSLYLDPQSLLTLGGAKLKAATRYQHAEWAYVTHQGCNHNFCIVEIWGLFIQCTLDCEIGYHCQFYWNLCTLLMFTYVSFKFYLAATSIYSIIVSF